MKKRGRHARTLWTLAGAAALLATWLAASHLFARPRTLSSSKWGSYDEAADAGELKRGWLAPSVPRGATALAEWHDLDTAECYGVFSLSDAAALEPTPAPAGFAQSVAQAQRVHPQDVRLPKIARSHDLAVSCANSGEFTSIVSVVARDAQAGVYWCLRSRCEERYSESSSSR